MRKRYIQLLSLIGLILTCSCCVFQWVNSGFFSTKNPTERLPLRTLTVETDTNQRDKLGEYLDAFSREHNLKVDTAFYTNKKYDGMFMYVAYGESLHISAVFRPGSRITDISFFENTKGVLPQQEYLDGIYNDLKAYISEFPGVVILEEK